MKLKTLLNIPRLLKDSMRLLQKNDPLRLAGATAFFTTFALPAILVILIQVLGLVFKREQISDNLLEKISSIVGKQTGQQVTETLSGFTQLADNWFITIGGFLFLIFVATTLFVVIKGSLNQLWGVRLLSHPKLGFRLRIRIRSLLVILVAGLLFIIGLMVDSLQLFLGNSLREYLPQLMPVLLLVSNIFISVVIVSGWFIILFRFLPDGHPTWKVAIIGGLFTSIFFNLGKWIIRFLLSNGNLDSLYGASASVVLLLLFVFYSALIFYFGAAFTKVLSNYIGEPIRTSSHAEKSD
ncbi:MAG: YihY/virulence factor BrkB family protein [Chitinophagaceae bacterium]|nr:YihY/virulence factor BrkB family protein [Chitinophagaceae bacterium]